MSKATFVLVPGAGHGPNIYFTVINKLNEQGYPTITLVLPSNGADPPHETSDEDVKAIRDTLTRLVDTEKKEVILVLHSNTGIPGVEATKGLSKMERHAKSLEGGVARLVFIAAFRMSEGSGPTVECSKVPEWIRFDFEVRPTLNYPLALHCSAAFPKNTTPTIAELLNLILSIFQKGIVTENPEDAKKMFYNDFSPDQQDKRASKLRHQSLGLYSSKPTDAAWLHVRSTYIGGDQNDTVSVPGIVDRSDETLQRVDTITVDRIEFRCEAGYCLMMSQPQWLFEMLIELAEYEPL